MRICHVSPHLPPDQAANALLPALVGGWSAARGHQVAFVAEPPAQGGTTGVELAGPVKRVRPRSASRLTRWLRIDAARRARSIVGALESVAREADLLHLHSNGLIVEVAAGWAARRSVPYLLTLYGTEIWHYRRRWPIDPFTRAYRGARAVTFYSQGLLDHAVSLGLTRAACHVVYPPVAEAFQAVDEDTRARWRAELGITEARVILNVKRLHPLAAQADLIAAFAEIARDQADVRLVIVGTGPLRQDLEARAEAAGVRARVTMTGLLPNVDVARLAAVADVFALPSKLEALPTVAVEALAAGTPVVSADHPGGRELQALFGRDVLVVARGDVRALARALRESLETPRRTTAETRAVVANRFGRAAVERAYEDLYRRALM